tara:strand:+ start:328 stop:975 length:648 start_codon:yes stop_codon:yes gene_type:complete
MSNIFSLKREAEKAAYKYFDKNIRPLKKNENGEVDNTAPGLVDNDVDAFRHAYVSGRYVQEYNEVVAKILGDAQEVFPGGSSNPQNSDAAKNMDKWNNDIGRKYGKKAKSREELAELLKKALENGELIISLDDSRKFGVDISYQYDPNRPVIVLKENKTGRNELFCDLSNGDIFDRESFVTAIGNGEYPGYTVASIDGLATPMSKPDGVASNNLG